MAYTIYLRTNLVNGKQYVGQTENFKHREECWKSFNKSNYANWYLEEERRKYGLDNFNVVIIDNCETQEEAYVLEEYYIKELGTKYPNGYNMTDGGVGRKGSYVSEEAKSKISSANKGNTPWNKGKKSCYSKETLKKMSENAKGRKHSEEWKRQQSERMKGENNPFYGKKLPDEALKRAAEKNSIPILQIDKTTNEIIKEWSSAHEVQRVLGINVAQITACCKGRNGYKTAGGFKWKYKNEDD